MWQGEMLVLITKKIIESIFTYSKQKGVGLSFSSKSKKKVIGLDEEKYERILLNLLSNAVKFTPKGHRVLVMILSKNNYVFIRIKDEGIGIPKEKQELIFDRFGQVDSSLSRQAEGSGIGLSLVKKYLELLDGSISVESKVNEGSTFTVKLPATKVAESKFEENRELTDDRFI